MRLILLRHGYSAFNKLACLTGQFDAPLDAVGHEQAEKASEYILQNFVVDKIYSSDLCRAVNTAKPISDALGLPIIKSAALRELDLGKWQGMKISEVGEKYPDVYPLCVTDSSVPFGGAESYDDLIKRASDEIKRIATENNGKNVLVATHGGFIRALLFAFGYQNAKSVFDIEHITNCSVTVIDYDGEKSDFICVNKNDYL